MWLWISIGAVVLIIAIKYAIKMLDTSMKIHKDKMAEHIREKYPDDEEDTRL